MVPLGEILVFYFYVSPFFCSPLSPGKPPGPLAGLPGPLAGLLDPLAGLPDPLAGLQILCLTSKSLWLYSLAEPRPFGRPPDPLAWRQTYWLASQTLWLAFLTLRLASQISGWPPDPLTGLPDPLACLQTL